MEVSSLTLNRLSVYLRCLQALRTEGVERISSQELARRFQLSASQIRKDLAHFGEFGIRGVGYEVDTLAERLTGLLGLDRQHRVIVVGVGQLGGALARFLGFRAGGFRVVAAVDKDRDKVGHELGPLTIQHSSGLRKIVKECGAEIGVLAVPADAAQANYEALVEAGVRAVLNFAPVQLELRPGIPTKNVDLRINLEELAFYLQGKGAKR